MYSLGSILDACFADDLLCVRGRELNGNRREEERSSSHGNEYETLHFWFVRLRTISLARLGQGVNSLLWH